MYLEKKRKQKTRQNKLLILVRHVSKYALPPSCSSFSLKLHNLTAGWVFSVLPFCGVESPKRCPQSGKLAITWSKQTIKKMLGIPRLVYKIHSLRYSRLFFIIKTVPHDEAAKWSNFMTRGQLQQCLNCLGTTRNDPRDRINSNNAGETMIGLTRRGVLRPPTILAHRAETSSGACGDRDAIQNT